MRNTRYFVLAFFPVMLNAQDAVPLKNWAAPLYWQPTQAERLSSGRSAAQLQFSTNQVSTDALTFIAITPCRLVDTRGAAAGFIGSIPFNGPYIQGGQTVTFPVQSNTEGQTTAPTPCGTIPSTAEAYSLNLTLVPHPLGTPVNYVTMWPDNGSAIPSVSTLNDQQGAVVANSAIVPAGTNAGGIKVFAYGATDVIIDMNGFYAAPSTAGPGENTAIGGETLAFNSTGSGNTATGYWALNMNTSGSTNAAEGAFALGSNTAGNGNSASGFGALGSNTTGSGNSATGYEALYSGTTGSNNTAVGFGALWYNKTGNNNIAIGTWAAANILGGSSDNIHIGTLGSLIDSGTIRIGSSDANPQCTPACGPQTSFFAAGIRGVTTGYPQAVPVVIDANGQLGTVSSSRRYKEDIQDMGDASSGLLRLRPVTFRYKQAYQDGSKPVDYGLIAEEVAEVYPDLVAYSLDGKIETVQYQKLSAMLLNEVQKQHREIEEQREEMRAEIGALKARLFELEDLLEKFAAPK